MSLPRSRRAYDRVNGNEDDARSGVAVTESELPIIQSEDTTAVITLDAPIADEEESGERIVIVVMDPAQSKFDIRANPDWTIQKFKEVSVTVHKVPPASQRLIYRGCLLADQRTLRDAGITTDQTIVHLFPKPRVVVSSDENTSNTSTDSGGAHIPQIVLDPREAELRSSILVLGSTEIIEAQNNVKLLSFLLLIICSMELLALFTILLGVPDDTVEGLTDDTVTPAIGDDTLVHPDVGEPRTWRNSDYFDLCLSAFGFYVAMLGIKATTENTRRLSRRYLICTIIVGCLWNGFYYYLNVQAEKDLDAKRIAKHTDDVIPPMSDKDFLVQAFLAIIIPAMVWVLCCIRAFQFHSLLRVAEEEAEERVRGELDLEEGTQSPPQETNRHEELAVHNDSATLT